VVEFVPDDLMKEYTEKISKHYDVEILTNDYIESEIKGLYQKILRFQDLLADMEDSKHPDLMKFYKDRDLIEEKIDLLDTFRNHRRNLIIKEIEKRNRRVRR
jgi:hypothetical protein